MSDWLDTFPHDIHASVLLLDGKIESWKIGNHVWNHPMEAKAYWKMNRINDYTVQSVKWKVYNKKEHQDAFGKGRDWMRQWPLSDDFDKTDQFSPY